MMLKKYLEAREIREEALRNVKTRMYQRFDENYGDWLQIVKNISEIDCLISLSIYRSSTSGIICRPEFINSDKNIFEVEELRHPCLTADPGKDFIPNNTFLGGGKHSNLILLTGPNMVTSIVDVITSLIY